MSTNASSKKLYATPAVIHRVCVVPLLPLGLILCVLSRLGCPLACCFVRYTNDINPFGDSNLTEQFVWGKKREKEGTANQQLSKRDIREIQKKNVDEIEKVSVFAMEWRRRGK